MRRDKNETKYASSLCGVERSLWQEPETHINKVRGGGVNSIVVKFQSEREASYT